MQVRWMAMLVAVEMAAGQGTRAEIVAVDWKITSFHRYFSAVWHDFFINNQPRLYASPKIVPYAAQMQTACGPIAAGNAGYCFRDNAVYYHQGFLVGTAQAAAAVLKSDGDYAPIVIVAHELGHAAAYWHTYGRPPGRIAFPAEQLADCLAGAVTQSAERAGKLAHGDLREAEFTIESGGSGQKGHGHGTAAERLRAFRKGYRGSVGACLSDLRASGY